MLRVILESPYAAPTPEELQANIAYARRALRDSLHRGESPIASHLLLTQVLHDDNPIERQQGIAAGLAWGRVAEATVVYADLGISAGMRHGIAHALRQGRPVHVRWLDVLEGDAVELKATRAEDLVQAATDAIVQQIAATQARIEAANAAQPVKIKIPQVLGPTAATGRS